jgi:hypothetical protein
VYKFRFSSIRFSHGQNEKDISPHDTWVSVVFINGLLLTDATQLCWIRDRNHRTLGDSRPYGLWVRSQHYQKRILRSKWVKYLASKGRQCFHSLLRGLERTTTDLQLQLLISQVCIEMNPRIRVSKIDRISQWGDTKYHSGNNGVGRVVLIRDGRIAAQAAQHCLSEFHLSLQPHASGTKTNEQ